MMLLLFGSCSKEQSFRNCLLRDTGKWNITTIDYELIEVDSIKVNTFFGLEFSAGTFTFKKNGHGDYDYTIKNNVNRKGKFSWHISDEHIVLYNVANDQGVALAAGMIFLVDYNGSRTGEKSFEMTGVEQDGFFFTGAARRTVAGTLHLDKQ